MPTLDDTFSALADPTRRAILARLAQGQASVNDLVAPFDISQPAISRHLKVLERAGLISRRAQGTKRLCALAPGALAQIDQWLAMMRDAFTANYDRLDHVLAEMNPQTAQPDQPPKET
jgi:DNA-binding transcriptional ArsR family regulator